MGDFTPTVIITAEKTSVLVGREKELKKLYEAIYRKDNTFVAVFVRGRGGLGKTRLLEELLWRGGNFDARQKRPFPSHNIPSELDWWQQKVTISNVIDMIDAHLHARNALLRQIRDSLRWPTSAGGGEFPRYDSAYDTLRRLTAEGADFTRIKDAAETAVSAFMLDLAEITKTRRLVWVLDTVEQLSFVSSDWLLQQEVLRPEDMATRSYQWLVQLICNHQIKNVTLVLAGRAVEGKPFFDDIEKAITEANTPKRTVKKVDISLSHFTETETRQYFEQKQHDFQEKGEKYQWITNYFVYLADEKQEQYKVLHLYTGGVPIRIALYTQLVIESRVLPPQLRTTYTEAEKLANNPTQLQLAQWQIEDEFINLLFGKPYDLRVQILKALIRAPRGLTAEQLHYILDSRNQPPSEWKADQKRLQMIKQEMEALRQMEMVKVREGGSERTETEEGFRPFRLGLQDEIYRIYAEHMAPHIEPQSEEMQKLWPHLQQDKEENARYQQNWEDECEERQDLYQKLAAWAEFQYQKFLNQKREILQKDEQTLELKLVPHDKRSFQFPDLSYQDTIQRTRLQDDIRDAGIEKMVYELLQDPEQNFNISYVDLTDDKSVAFDVDTNFLTQTEMWRVIFDSYAMKFTRLRQRPVVKQRGETPLIVLRRAAEQENAARWIKQFVILGEYDRAREFTQRVEWAIQHLVTQRELENEYIWLSWRHTLAHGERVCWRIFAQVYAGDRIEELLNELYEEMEKLIKLANSTTQEVAIEHHDGYVEYGFAGDRERGIEPHPGWIRVKRIISHAFNVLGYGLISLGRVREAVEAYGLALTYLRDTHSHSHRATVLNNLSKALSDLGRRSERMCLDGLDLRRKIGAEVPTAYSYNTLALIYDDQDRPEEAWALAAKAAAYFRRAGHGRGLGLALLQLAEALRHVAAQVRRGKTFVSTPDSLYTVAQDLLKEAREIFADGNEPVRLVEIDLELGSLYRDWARSDPTPSSRYRESLSYFESGMKLAEEKLFVKFLVDGHINLAWTHESQNRLEEAEKSLENAKKVIQDEIEEKRGEKYLITSQFLPNAEELNNVWVFNQLSKYASLNGRIAMERFHDRVAALKKEHELKKITEPQKHHLATQNDSQANKQLLLAVHAYVLALEYATLFSPFAATITLIEDNLYSYLKQFNQFELDSFHNQLHEWELQHPIITKKMQGPKLLEQFLHEFFGLEWHTHE